MPRVKQEPQLGLQEEHLENPGLVETLESWAAAHADAKEALSFIKKETKAKSAVVDLVPDDGADHIYRVGPYQIKVSHTEAQDIEFERKGGRRLRISEVNHQ